MSVSSDVAKIPGWYGKLPSLGDFASRRLEADFIEPWDLWLGEALQALRDSLGESWLEAYLDTPPWRFLLAPGALPRGGPQQVFAGVLVPSVDRVGRHFPLTLVASLRRMPDAAAEFDALLAWLHRLEDTALDALQGEWSIEELEDALTELPPPSGDASHSVEDRVSTMRRAVATAVQQRGGFVDIAAVSNRTELASIFAGPPTAPAPRPAPHGVGLWVADIPGRAQLLVSDGLPSVHEFARMFAGGAGSGANLAARRSPEPEDDDLVTLPQALDPPMGAAAAAATVRLPDDIDLLSMFGNEAAPPDAAPAGAPRDDILALFQVDGSAPADDAEAPIDPLAHSGHGLFDGGDALPAAEPPPEAGKDDILAMFSAEGATPADPFASAEAAWSEDDPLGLKVASPADEARHETPVGQSASSPSGEPDILDMFGVVPGKPAADESK